MQKNIEELVEPLAKAVEMPIPAEARASVAMNLQRLADAADAVMSFPMSDDIEIAQEFTP